MIDLTNLSAVRELLGRHGFHTSKAMGQNFLINPTVCPRMAEASGAGAGVGVLEIGPGIGVLTRELAERADKVVAIELDKRLPDILKETLEGYSNVQVIGGDVLELDLHALIEREFAGLEVVVCANLPYYITTPILMRLLEGALPIRRITVMVQREVADRLCKEPPGRSCSPISYAVWYRAEPARLFTVPAGSFLPAPKVDSAVICLEVRQHPEPDVQHPEDYFALIRAAFSQRRKTILNAIPSGYPIDKGTLAEALGRAELSPTARAEALSLEDYARLQRAIQEVKGK